MFRVSCIQLKSNNNINNNIKKTEKLIIKAVKQKTDFILTPEASSLFSLDKKQLLKFSLLEIFGIFTAIILCKSFYRPRK